MPSMFGIYRRTFGDKIVKSSFNYDDSTIGPYTLPMKLNHVDVVNTNLFYEYKYYEAMLADEQALAVFNVNNYCLCVVTRNEAYQVPATNTPKLDLVKWSFREPLRTPIYEHVGYVKSYHDCLAISQMPTYLIREVASNKAVDFEEPLKGTPQLNPPLSLYKELINSEAKAVYFDEVTQQPMFLYK